MPVHHWGSTGARSVGAAPGRRKREGLAEVYWAMPFMREVTPRFHQLDPAGILFFGEVFALCSGVYEDFIQSLGFGWDEWFRSPALASPVRHAGAEYFAPLQGGQAYQVDVQVLAVGASSFEMGFEVRRKGVLHCRARIVHVFIHAQTRAKAPVPDDVRAAFSRFAGPADAEGLSAAASPAGSAEAGALGATAEHAQTAAPAD